MKCPLVLLLLFIIIGLSCIAGSYSFSVVQTTTSTTSKQLVSTHNQLSAAAAAAAATTTRSSYDPSVQDVFTAELAATLAIEVQKAVNIPFVPYPVVEFVLKQAIQNLSTGVSPRTLRTIQEFLAAAATISPHDDFSQADREALAKQVAKELRPNITVPMLDEEQELLVLEEVFKIVFASTSRSALRQHLLQARITVSRTLFGSPESRLELARNINAMIDIPLLDEQQELDLILATINRCAETLQSLLPPAFIDTLKCDRPEAVQEMKHLLLQQVRGAVMIPGVSAEKRDALVEKVVNVLLEKYVDGTDMEFLILNVEEQVIRWEQQCAVLESELEYSRERYQREQRNLKARLKRSRERLKQAQRKLKPNERRFPGSSLFRRWRNVITTFVDERPGSFVRRWNKIVLKPVGRIRPLLFRRWRRNVSDSSSPKEELQTNATSELQTSATNELHTNATVTKGFPLQFINLRPAWHVFEPVSTRFKQFHPFGKKEATVPQPQRPWHVFEPVLLRFKQFHPLGKKEATVPPPRPNTASAASQK